MDPNHTSRNQENEHCIFKSGANLSWCLQNERDVLRRYQSRTPHIRPLSDEIDNPPALILKYLDDNALQASKIKKMSRSEAKFVARGVLEALKTLHEGGDVHTGTLLQSPTSYSTELFEVCLY